MHGGQVVTARERTAAPAARAAAPHVQVADVERAALGRQTAAAIEVQADGRAIPGWATAAAAAAVARAVSAPQLIQQLHWLAAAGGPAELTQQRRRPLRLQRVRQPTADAEPALARDEVETDVDGAAVGPSAAGRRVEVPADGWESQVCRATRAGHRCDGVLKQ